MSIFVGDALDQLGRRDDDGCGPVGDHGLSPLPQACARPHEVLVGAVVGSWCCCASGCSAGELPAVAASRHRSRADERIGVPQSDGQDSFSDVGANRPRHQAWRAQRRGAGVSVGCAFPLNRSDRAGPPSRKGRWTGAMGLSDARLRCSYGRTPKRDDPVEDRQHRLRGGDRSYPREEERQDARSHLPTRPLITISRRSAAGMAGEPSRRSVHVLQRSRCAANLTFALSPANPLYSRQNADNGA